MTLASQPDIRGAYIEAVEENTGSLTLHVSDARKGIFRFKGTVVFSGNILIEGREDRENKPYPTTHGGRISTWQWSAGEVNRHIFKQEVQGEVVNAVVKIQFEQANVSLHFDPSRTMGSW